MKIDVKQMDETDIKLHYIGHVLSKHFEETKTAEMVLTKEAQLTAQAIIDAGMIPEYTPELLALAFEIGHDQGKASLTGDLLKAIEDQLETVDVETVTKH